MNKKSIFIGLKVVSVLAFAVLLVPMNAHARARNVVYGEFQSWYNEPVSSYQAPVENPRPVINSINPSSGYTGEAPKTITITGRGFVPGSVARVNNANRQTTFIDSSHVMVQVAPSDMYIKDGFYITVWNGAPGGGYSNASFFEVKEGQTPANSYPASRNTNSGISYNRSHTSYYDPATGNYVNRPGYVDTNGNYVYDARDLSSNVIFGGNTFMPSGLIQWVLIAIFIVIAIILVRRISGAQERYHASPLKHD